MAQPRPSFLCLSFPYGGPEAAGDTVFTALRVMRASGIRLRLDTGSFFLRHPDLPDLTGSLAATSDAFCQQHVAE